MRPRSPLNRNETLLARAFAQPDPSEPDLTEGVGPEQLLKIAQLLTRTGHKLTAAARNNDRGAMQCLVAASGLVSRAEREAGGKAPEAAAAAEEKLRHFDIYNEGHHSHTIGYHAIKRGLAVCPHAYLAAIRAAQQSPSAEDVAPVEEAP